MSKWANSRDEVAKISEFSQQLTGLAIVRVTLDNDTVIEGVLRHSSVGNNAGAGGVWAYYGNFDIETLDRHLFNIDLCEVKSIANIWSVKSKEYEAAGLIQIVDWPK